MCKLIQYIHIQCGHPASAPFVYEPCEGACHIDGPMASKAGEATRALRRKTDKRATAVLLGSLCQKCEKKKTPEGKKSKFDPYSARHQPLIDLQGPSMNEVQWYVPYHPSTDPGFGEIKWRPTSFENLSELIDYSDETSPQSPKSVDSSSSFDMNQIRSRWESWSFDENAATCPKPLGLMKPKPLKLTTTSQPQTTEATKSEQNDKAEPTQQQEHQNQTLSLLEGAIQPTQSELEAEILSQLDTVWPLTNTASSIKSASVSSNKPSTNERNPSKSQPSVIGPQPPPHNRPARDSQSLDFNPWCRTLSIQPVIEFNSLVLAHNVERRFSAKITHSVWPVLDFPVYAPPQQTQPGLSPVSWNSTTAATELLELESEPEVTTPTLMLVPATGQRSNASATDQEQATTGSRPNPLKWVVILMMILFILNTLYF